MLSLSAIIIAIVLLFSFMANQTQAKSLTMGAIALTVRDLKTMQEFYQNQVGLEVISEQQDQVVMGSKGQPIIRLYASADLEIPSTREAGLYHSAIVFPTRSRLAQAINRILTTSPDKYQGSADHTATEAFYFADPEGNGVELYFDRPRSEWVYQDGKPVLGSTYINERTYLATHINTTDTAEATKMGHVHLRVGDIERARKFYAQTLMFDVMNSSTDSLFIARDGYHHHIGMNTWQSIGAGFRDKSKYGLRYFEINYTDAAIFERIKQNLRSENINFELSGNTIRTADPWNNRLELHFK